MTPEDFEAALDDERIVAAIRAAEARSCGEIRVHVAEREVADSQAEAERLFAELGVRDTAMRNGVLVYVAPLTRTIVVVGDDAVAARCGEGLWTGVVETIRDQFRAGRFTEGIVAGVEAIGEVLARHFPRRPGEADRNELPDAVSRG
jgi:uncharacterized membrane protein